MRTGSVKNRVHGVVGLVMCAVIFLGAAAAAENVFGQSRILAGGEPPLTSEMVSRYAGLLEWSLDLQFSETDGSALEKQLVKSWQAGDEKYKKGILDTLAFEKNLRAADDAKRREVQPQIKQKLLETMEADSSDALNALLLGIYRRNQSAANAGGGDGADAVENSSGLAELIGRWQVLHGNSIYSSDPVSGRIGDGNAMIAQYDIRPDGRVIFTFVLQQSNYGCTTRVKTSKTGRASVSGSRLTFNYDGGTTTSEDGCNAKYNYTKKLAPERETLEFKLGQKDGKEAFCFENGKIKDCAVKVK